MSSSIKLKNAHGKTLSVTNSNANQTNKEVIYLNTVDELDNASGSINAVAIVSDLSRGGTFEWSETGTANGGTVFAGATGYWNRQYSDKSTLSLDWFGVLYNKEHITDIYPDSEEDYFEVTFQLCLFIINFTFVWNEY